MRNGAHCCDGFINVNQSLFQTETRTRRQAFIRALLRRLCRDLACISTEKWWVNTFSTSFYLHPWSRDECLLVFGFYIISFILKSARPIKKMDWPRLLPFNVTTRVVSSTAYMLFYIFCFVDMNDSSHLGDPMTGKKGRSRFSLMWLCVQRTSQARVKCWAMTVMVKWIQLP